MADPNSIPVPVRHPRATNWKGGRSVASNGYVLVKLPGHHLADVRGYVYEHRLVAEQKLGRQLLKGEIPHHINGIKTDNRPENIEVVESIFAHRVRHRSAGRVTRQNPHDENEFITCGCGCGEMFAKFDSSGRPRKFISGHNPHDAQAEQDVLDAIADGRVHRTTLAARVGKPVAVIAQSLSKLKRKGVVRQTGHGVWERVS